MGWGAAQAQLRWGDRCGESHRKSIQITGLRTVFSLDKAGFLLHEPCLNQVVQCALYRVYANATASRYRLYRWEAGVVFRTHMGNKTGHDGHGSAFQIGCIDAFE